MPELPEVETLRRDLHRVIVGKTIKSVTVNWPKMIRPFSVTKFNNGLRGKKIIGIDRRAKVLIIKLSGEKFLIIHLKMTGQLIYRYKLKANSYKLLTGGHPQQGGTDHLPNKYTHAIINFRDGSTLFFNDLRKFGWMRLVDKNHINELSNALGVEPLNTDFTLEQFNKILKRYPSRKIKQVLTDQTLIAGIGNIYADESCFYARILPMRRVGSLTNKETRLLHQHIPQVLKLSISKKGTSFSDYVQLDGKQGRMVKWLRVYNKTGQPCSVCSTPIKKIKLNGRGTHFCPRCQK